MIMMIMMIMIIIIIMMIMQLIVDNQINIGTTSNATNRDH